MIIKGTVESAGSQPKTMRQWLPSTQAAHKQLISDCPDYSDNSESQSHPNTAEADRRASRQQPKPANHQGSIRQRRSQPHQQLQRFPSVTPDFPEHPAIPDYPAIPEYPAYPRQSGNPHSSNIRSLQLSAQLPIVMPHLQHIADLLRWHIPDRVAITERRGLHPDNTVVTQ